MTQRLAKLSVLLFATLPLVGCDSGTLETGYRPHKLTDSPSERRAYYASPYSPEKAEARSEDAAPDLRRPRGY